ncbi:MAG: type I DNA topoisomerase [Bacilli bacterium]|nr:type I DNA topoisomerase [Bacilli bacterium]
MPKYLVIVESPAKSKTIEKYLGKDYAVTSSKGHIRDLTTRGYGGFGVDIENGFKPMYKILKDKQALVKELKKDIKSYEKVFLATDPDREGEAISWHLYDTLDLANMSSERIVFHEITKNAVLSAFDHGRDIDLDLVKSQESRRIVDRIIGFSLSKLLQKKIGSKSAGRVQSVALKLIVDREKEVNAFIPEEYWEVFLDFTKKNHPIKAKLEYFNHDKVKLASEQEVNQVLNALKKSYEVVEINKKNREKVSKPPFITSTLQQESSSKYNFSAKKTMMVAQRLYEGIELENERVGLITYMRTDSTRLASEFIVCAKDYIISNYGESYYRGYKDTSKPEKNIQDAHEAIRPSSLAYTPENVKPYLSSEEYKIYSIIFARAVASMMTPALVEDEQVVIENNGYQFVATGEKVLFEGFLKAYKESNQTTPKSLPQFHLHDLIEDGTISTEQKFTNPPLRYSEARLIKKMEELGIGRPSTYAVTMETLKIRNYVHQEKKAFIPTKQGILTSEKLDEFFQDIINIKYTAEMEETLDEISEGKKVWNDELATFYTRFKPWVDYAENHMEKIYPVFLEEKCPECGSKLVIRNGRFGEFVACSGFPKCRYIKKTEKEQPISTGIKCPNCEVGMIVERISKRGRQKGKLFFACDQYPTCKTTYSSLDDIKSIESK